MAKEMNPEARAARREYMRKWRAEHPEAVKAAQVRYWAKKAEALKNETGNQDTININQRG